MTRLIYLLLALAFVLTAALACDKVFVEEKEAPPCLAATVNYGLTITTPTDTLDLVFPTQIYQTGQGCGLPRELVDRIRVAMGDMDIDVKVWSAQVTCGFRPD